MAVGVQPLLKAGHELLGCAGIIVLIKEGGAIHLHAGAFLGIQNNAGLPCVACGNGLVKACRSSLCDDLGCVGGGAGSKDHICTGVDGVLDVGGEVRGALGELLAGNSAAQILKSVDEVGGQTGAVVLAQHAQHVGVGSTELILCKVCHDRALERVKEADTEVVGVGLSHGGVGAGAANGRDGSGLEGGSGCNGNTGAVAAQHDGDFLGDQLLCSSHGLIGAGLVIHFHQLHVIGLTADLHGGSKAVGILDTQHFLLAACAVITGSRFKHADLNGLAACRRAACGTARRRAACQSCCCGGDACRFQEITTRNECFHKNCLLYYFLTLSQIKQEKPATAQ